MMLSRKEHWQNRKDRVSQIHFCASERTLKVINRFTVENVNFFTINIKFNLFYLLTGGGIHVRTFTGHPPPKSEGIFGAIEPRKGRSPRNLARTLEIVQRERPLLFSKTVYRFSRSNVRNIRATVILGNSNVNREIKSPLSKTNILTG